MNDIYLEIAKKLGIRGSREHRRAGKYGRIGAEIWEEWHVGEPVPEVGRVVTFQADGDELELILKAMEGRNGRRSRSTRR